MNKLKTHFFLTLLAIMLPLLGMAQTLTFTVDHNPVCAGNTSIFSIHVSGNYWGQIEAYELYKNNIPIEQHSLSVSDDEFTVVADETAEYVVKVYIGYNTKYEVTSNSILLTVNQPTTATYVESSCNLYEWHDVIYYESGTYYFDTINANECRHTDTLHLTINKISDIVLNGDETVCDNSDVEYSVTTSNGTDLLYQWQVTGGTIVSSDTTEKIIVRWNQNMSEGMVSVEVTDTNTGCSAEASKNISIITLISENLNTIEAKKNTSGIPYILIYPNPEPNYQYYQWYKYDEPIEDANRQYLYLQGNTSTEIDSIYRVYVATYSDGNTLVCGKYSEYYVSNPLSSGKTIIVSPNPVGRSQTINIYTDNAKDNFFVKVYSPDGRIILGDKASGNPIKIVADFPEGVYVAEITDNEGNKYFEKVIIK